MAEFNCIGHDGGKPKERSKLTKCAPIFFNAEVHFQVNHVPARDRYVSVRKQNLEADRAAKTA